MDLTTYTAPDSSQINGDDLIAGPITVTIAAVRQGSDEQPVNIDLVERPGRAYRPSKSMLRVLVAAWGPKSDVYPGRRMTLYRNPDIKFGRDVVGGIEISHLSHLERPMTVPLTVTRGKKRNHRVEPLPHAAPSAHPMPEFETVDQARSYYMERQQAGADAAELEEIKSVANAIGARS